MQVRVAAIQAAPDPTDLDRTLEIAEGWMERAAAEGVQLVAFPETFFPGYPAWLDTARDAALWDHPPVKRAYAKLVENAVEIPGPAILRLQDAARRLALTVVANVHERVRQGSGHGTLYNTLVFIDADGRLLSTHRKLVPTYAERLVWGPGDGAGLHAVETAAGRVGGLICWEHWMPLARQALHETNEQIHVAVWPTVKEMHRIASRHYAFEGRCFVIAAGSLLARTDLPEGLELADDVPEMVLDGGSTILGPDGAVLAGPVFGEETLVIADLDLERIVEESMSLDVTGHYARPDVLRLERLGGARLPQDA